MPALQFLRRRLAWFLPTFSPTGLEIPSKLAIPSLLLVALLPLSAGLTSYYAQPMFLILNLFSIVALLGKDLLCHRSFQLGRDAGRAELVAEMVIAWSEREIHPGEYVHRELWHDPDEVRDAQKAVLRSARRRPR